MIVQLIVQIEVKIDEDQWIVVVFPNVEVIERDRPINGPTLTADDRTVLNGIDAIHVVRKEVVHGFPMIRAVVVIVTIPMMIDDAVQGVVVDVVMVASFHQVVVEIIPFWTVGRQFIGRRWRCQGFQNAEIADQIANVRWKRVLGELVGTLPKLCFVQSLE